MLRSVFAPHPGHGRALAGYWGQERSLSLRSWEGPGSWQRKGLGCRLAVLEAPWKGEVLPLSQWPRIPDGSLRDSEAFPPPGWWLEWRVLGSDDILFFSELVTSSEVQWS